MKARRRRSLYQKYVGHDNNRDWYIFSQAETRLTVAKLHNVWHPQIVYDVHQQGGNAARMFVPPWLDPTEPNIDPILMQEMNMIGHRHGGRPDGGGQDRGGHPRRLRFLDAVAALPGVSRRVAHPHRIGQRADRFADHHRRRTRSPQTALGYNPRERSWNYLEPWLGGTWRLRDIIDYQLIALDSCLYNAALHREELLRNFYRVGAAAGGAHRSVGLRDRGAAARSGRHAQTDRDAALRPGGGRARRRTAAP